MKTDSPDICENCEKPIVGAIYRTVDDYTLCVDCWVELKDDMEIAEP
jgi:hypothetical protein